MAAVTFTPSPATYRPAPSPRAVWPSAAAPGSRALEADTVPELERRVAGAPSATRPLVVLVVLVLLAWGGVSAARVITATPSVDPAASSAPVSPGPGAEPMFHIVEPGDSLWSIASRLQPTGDVRPLVDELVARNGGETTLVPGQVIDLSGL